MESNLKYKKAFLITAYVALIEFCLLPIYEFPLISEGRIKPYIISKIFILTAFLGLLFCVHTLRLVKYWVFIFHLCCFSYVIIGQFFNPGYHLAVVQYLFLCAIIFEGFPWASTILLVIFMTEYRLLPFYHESFPAYPFYHSDIFNALISSWAVSIALERYVSRVKIKQGFLDRKLRYKGIKTDLFMHDLKNQLQPLMFEYPDSEELYEIVRNIQAFNSFKDIDEMSFEDVVMGVKEKFKIEADITVLGDEDFFIDQMDLQTILSNLMRNSMNASKQRNMKLSLRLKNTHRGFTYEDNAGGMTDEQMKLFSQKEFRPYEGHEKKGLGMLLIKKLIEHHGGKLIIKKIHYGTRFEIAY